MQKPIYTSKRLVIPQQLPADFSEIYFIIDFSSPDNVTEIIIDNQGIQNEVLKLLEKGILREQLPYGYSEYNEMMHHLIHPHSVIGDGENNIYIFYKQIPYYRKINLDTKGTELLPLGEDFDPDAIYPSTSQMDIKGNFYVSVNSFASRLQKYTSKHDNMEFKVGHFNTKTKKLSIISDTCAGLIDNVHQVGYSSKDFLVLIDMNLAVDYPLSPNVDVMSQSFRENYPKADFPVGNFYVYDLITRSFYSSTPPLPTIAHAEFDLADPSIFYISCHNMSKIKTKMVLHGPAAIVKYQYENGKIKELGTYSSDDFYRITTHKLFARNGKNYLAVNGYPNYLFILETDSLKLVSKIKLFDSDERVHFDNGVYFSTDSNFIPLYLDVSEDGRFVFMPSAQFVYVVDLDSNTVVETVQFTQKTCIPTAHVLLV